MQAPPVLIHGEEAKVQFLAVFSACSQPRGTLSCSSAVFKAALSPAAALSLPDFGDGNLCRDDLLVCLLQKPLGKELFGEALKLRASALCKAASEASTVEVWPGSPEGVNAEAAWLAFASGPPAALRTAWHFEAVAAAGMDANAVAFPHAFRPVPMPTAAWGPAPRDGNNLVFELPEGTKPEALREEVHAVGVKLDTELEPWTTVAMGVIAGDQDVALVGAGAAWHVERERLAVDPGFFSEGRWLRAAVYEEERELDMEVVPWPCAEEGAIREDRLLPVQAQVQEARLQHGPLSQAAVQRRRLALAGRLGGEAPPARFFEEVRPVLEREAALAEVRARWARDRAWEVAECDRLAAVGAEHVAWPAEGRWPRQPAAWLRHCRWFAMWRESRRLAQAEAPKASQGRGRSGSMDSGMSWEVLSESSDSSWQAVQQAPVAAEADIAELEAEHARLAAEYQRALEVQTQQLTGGGAAGRGLEGVSKGALQEIKSLAKPPHAVGLVSQALYLCLVTSPAKKSSAADYWKAAKVHVWGDPKLLQRLRSLEAEELPDRVLERLLPLVSDPSFQVGVVKRSSCAAAELCQLVHDLVAQAQAARRVAPQREALRQAEARLTAARDALQARQQPAPEAAVTKLQVLSDATASSRVALGCINKRDIVELKSFGRPPVDVMKTVCAVLALMGQLEATWKDAQAALGDVRFLERLLNFDGLEVSPAALRAVQRYTRDQGFTPEKVGKSSRACAGLCRWVHAMERLAQFANSPEKVAVGTSTPHTTAPTSPSRECFAASPASVSPMSVPSMPSPGQAVPICLWESAFDDVSLSSSIRELKSLAKPPAAVAALLAAVMQLQAGLNPDLAIDEQGHLQDRSWRAAQKLMACPKDFVASLGSVRACIANDTMPERNIQAARDLLSAGSIDKVSRSAADLGRWVAETVEYYDRQTGLRAE